MAAPDDWLELPSLGAVQPGEGPQQLTVEVREFWPRSEASAEVHAEEYRKILAAAYKDFELLEEGPSEVGQGEEAFRFVYNHADQEPRQNTELVIPRGPLVCHLIMGGPQLPDERRDRLFGKIAATFVFERDEAIAGARRTGLLDQASAPPETMTWSDLPQACVAVQLPTGWQVADLAEQDITQEVEARLFARGAEITIHRAMDADSDPEAWLNRQMAEKHTEAGVKIMGWDCGQIGEDRPYAGLSYSRHRQNGQWSAPEVTSNLDFATGDTMLLVWSLKVGREGWYPDAAAALVRILRDFRLLEPEQWQTCLPEPWIEQELRGRWICEGPGTYLKQDGGHRLFMQLRQQEITGKLKLAQVRPSMEEVIDTFRSGSPVLTVFAEDEAEGLWRGIEAFRYSLDAEFRDQGVMAARAVTALAEKILYTCLLFGSNREEVNELYLEVLENLAIPGMKDR